MAKTKFKVIDPKGVSVGVAAYKTGDTFEAETKSPHIQTALHFKQIERVVVEEQAADAKETEAKTSADEVNQEAETEVKETEPKATSVEPSANIWKGNRSRHDRK